MISLLVMNWLSNGGCWNPVCSCPFVLFVSRYPGLGLRDTMTGTCVIHGVYTYEGRRIYESTFDDIAVLFGDLTKFENLFLDLFFCQVISRSMRRDHHSQKAAIPLIIRPELRHDLILSMNIS